VQSGGEHLLDENDPVDPGVREVPPVDPGRDMHLYLGSETGYTYYPALAAAVHQPEVFELAGIR
jgi:hypothetical protein